MNIKIVVPAYNEEKRIGPFLEDLKKIKYDSIIVDDGSRDSTKLKVKNAKLKSKNNLILLEHKINLGKGAAMKTGAEAAFKAGADAVVYMDADGQHSFDDLALFIDALEDGNQFVIGTRNLSLGVPLIRYIGNKAASMLVANLFGMYVSDLLCGYRAMTKDAYEKIKWETSGYAVETEMIVRLAKAKLKYCEVPVKTIYLDEVKGVTILDSFEILFNVVSWKLKKL